MSKKTSATEKQDKRISLVALIFSAIVFGLLAGLGGALLLTHSLIQRPLEEQQDIINRQNLDRQQELARLSLELEEQKESVNTLSDKIEYLITSDSTGYLKELAGVQRMNSEREQLILQHFAQLEQKIDHLANSNQEFNRTVDKAKQDLDRTDKTLRDDMQLLRSSVNDLKNKIQQLERQFDSR